MQAINSEPNFTGIYKFSNLSKSNQTIIKNFINSYYRLSSKPVVYLEGHPHTTSFNDFYSNLAQENNGSLNWLRQNAKFHGIHIPEVNDDNIVIITTERDVQDFLHFFTKEFKELKSNFNFLNRLKILLSDNLGVGKDADLPLYLKIVKHIASAQQKSIENFDKYFVKKDIINLTSLEEFIKRITQEK